MKIGLIDVDSHNFPNLAQMKISAFHKSKGDQVERWIPLKTYDLVYKSKVFDSTYTEDEHHVVMADKVIEGGTGYGLDNKLPEEVEHILTDKHCEQLNRMRLKMLHFAWDNYEMQTYEKLKRVRPLINKRSRELRVYVLTNFGTTMEENLERIYKLKELGFDPYVMIYDKPNAPREVKHLGRWVNNKYVFRTCETFEEYMKGKI